MPIITENELITSNNPFLTELKDANWEMNDELPLEIRLQTLTNDCKRNGVTVMGHQYKDKDSGIKSYLLESGLTEDQIMILLQSYYQQATGGVQPCLIGRDNGKCHVRMERLSRIEVDENGRIYINTRLYNIKLVDVITEEVIDIPGEVESNCVLDTEKKSFIFDPTSIIVSNTLLKRMVLSENLEISLKDIELAQFEEKFNSHSNDTIRLFNLEKLKLQTYAKNVGDAKLANTIKDVIETMENIIYSQRPNSLYLNALTNALEFINLSLEDKPTLEFSQILRSINETSPDSRLAGLFSKTNSIILKQKLDEFQKRLLEFRDSSTPVVRPR